MKRRSLFIIHLLIFLAFLFFSFFAIGSVASIDSATGQVTETVLAGSISPLVPLIWLVLIGLHLLWLMTRARREPATELFADKPKRHELALADDGELIELSEIDDYRAQKRG